MSPVSVRAKLLMQQLWQQHVTWDEPLDQELLTDWTAILTDICKCADIFVERRYFNINFTEHGNNIKLHALQMLAPRSTVLLFSFVAQTRQLCCGQRTCSPLKQITLPKLELMAAVIAARFTRFVMDSLRLDVIILASEYKAVTAICQSSGERDKTIDPQCYLTSLSNCGQPH